MRKPKLHAAVSLLALSVANNALATETEENGDEICLTQQKDTFLNPFSKESAHHRPIGSNAKYAGSDDPATQAVQKSGFGNINSNNGWGINVYNAGPDDPEKTVTAIDDGRGPKGGGGLPVTIRVPNGANNKDSSDGLVAIANGDVMHEFYVWKWNNGNPTSKFHVELNLTELGHTKNGERVGITSAGTSGMMGLLRGFEINTPGCKITHSLQLALAHGNYANGCPVQLDDKIVWPAMSTDWFCSSQPELCSSNIPYGGLLALPRSIKIDSLDLSEPGQRIAEAMQNYGAYVIDGAMCPILRADQFVNEDVRQKLKVDMQKIWTRLRLVTNNNKEDDVAGGGEPCAENTAYDSLEQQYDVSSAKCGNQDNNPPPNDNSPPGDTSPPDNNPPVDRTPPTEDAQPPDGTNPPGDKTPSGESQKKPGQYTPPPGSGNQPYTNKDDLKNQITEWLWEHLSRTKDGMETFKEWILQFFT